VRRAPDQFGHEQSRWTLAALLDTCAWLTVETEGGLCRLLARLDIHYKRARSYIHSPDPLYEAKRAYIAACLEQARQDPERWVLLYQDEFTFYRQPSVARDYEASGSPQPLARWSVHSNSWCRGIGAVNALTGQLTYQQHSKIGLRQLIRFHEALHQTYPQAEVIYLVQDNWPLHFHPDTLAPLAPPIWPFPLRLPPDWPTTPRPSLARTNWPIQCLFLPTYASWLNPIEKLWRWVRQAILHLHRLSDDWPALKQRVLDFMAQFVLGSTDLLRYIGLLLD
jgi:hypothetical protein